MKSSLLNSLFDEEERRPLTVSELNEQVKGAIEKRFPTVWVEAEILNFVAAHSGHWYFTLHDGDSQLKAACYIRNNSRIRFQPFDGLQVRVRGKLSLYKPRGEYQILVESLQPVGEGALKVAFEQVKLKLAKERLFDEELKRELPFFPTSRRRCNFAERSGFSRYFECFVEADADGKYCFDSDARARRICGRWNY